MRSRPDAVFQYDHLTTGATGAGVTTGATTGATVTAGLEAGLLAGLEAGLLVTTTAGAGLATGAATAAGVLTGATVPVPCARTTLTVTATTTRVNSTHMLVFIPFSPSGALLSPSILPLGTRSIVGLSEATYMMVDHRGSEIYTRTGSNAQDITYSGFACRPRVQDRLAPGPIRWKCSGGNVTKSLAGFGGRLWGLQRFQSQKILQIIELQ
jgi:hypothetical protein